jgi:hypothetical protein
MSAWTLKLQDSCRVLETTSRSQAGDQNLQGNVLVTQIQPDSDQHGTTPLSLLAAGPFKLRGFHSGNIKKSQLLQLRLKWRGGGSLPDSATARRAIPPLEAVDDVYLCRTGGVCKRHV